MIAGLLITLVVASVEVPALRARVTDLAGALPPERAAQIEQKLARYEQSTGHQLAVLIVPTLEGEDIAQYSLRVAERWRLGDARRDDGALLVVALNDRRMRIEVGYGLEGAIPDVVAGRIIRDVIAPRFSAGDAIGAMLARHFPPRAGQQNELPDEVHAA
jgi:uncharacterized protein